MSCGLWYSVCLVSIGLCHIKLLSCWLHGRASLEDIEIWIFGGLCHIACFGVYGGNRMLDALRTRKGGSLI